ncbi:hypothetical protein HBI56_181230 [Parastagonospora nodorum]|uniref:Uncharacterized protein n=1 Tax=Phaeosphaeria nodorum (strain SN15 / ATCC MYA-4574 / FGSC 10173) TaxID=321614 RepID=A0A7U2F935_PHANO|nr:hypothetical protein HBH56_186610 [Parastagonospora nodorum]QRD01006.1 hypothetical protein JI435_153920 [Parastagonospora nodorum SN15]KAH3925270.1 hypothetical protein HBH54_181940 [Parastagonospora nodorum]KAH3962147.1 hypothetical protein HBH52_227170 [Parastagonospora nodorum]KAH3992152.1 hypothetical protein HBI10_222850 [Parastagonospora nodorum]
MAGKQEDNYLVRLASTILRASRYPGCACDCPAHTYTWSFEPKTDWSQTFATSQEIHKYFTDFAAKYELEDYIKYSHAVVGASWEEAVGKWRLKIWTPEGIRHDSCELLINASGILNNWQWPLISGIDNFAGPKLHSAAWDETVDLTGKNVGLIGNGSSGIQILPAILPKAASVASFIREPTWITQMTMPGFEPRRFSDEEKAEFLSFPGKHLEYRKNIEHLGNSFFPLFLRDSPAQEQAMQQFSQGMKDEIPDPVLQEQLIPKWSVGCRRLTPGVDYLKALKDAKSKVVFGRISKISHRGPVMQDGTEHAIDVLICATGFDTTFKPRFPLKGPGGIDLAESWSQEPSSYLGLAAGGFPNYFMFLGPNSPIGNGPVLIGIEAQADYFMKFIQKFREENIKYFQPKVEAIRELTAHKDAWMSRSVWDRDCRSWYKNAPGKVTALWPGSVPHYLELLERPRFEDYDRGYEIEGNRWSFVGNGFSQRGARGADLSWYIRGNDNSIPLASTLEDDSGQLYTGSSSDSTE